MNKTLKVLLIIGAILSPILFGMLITVLAMCQAFHNLGDQGISDPKLLSTDIGIALIAAKVGLVTSGVFLIGWVIYLLANRKQPIS